MRPISWARSRELADLAQDGRAFHGRGALPGFEGTLRGGQGAVQVGFGGVRQLAKHLERGRIDDVLRAPAVARQELAIDIQCQLFIHACQSSRIYGVVVFLPV